MSLWTSFHSSADGASNLYAPEDNLQEYKRILAAGGNLPLDPTSPAQSGQRPPQEGGIEDAFGQVMGGEAMDLDQPDMPNMDDFGLRE